MLKLPATAAWLRDPGSHLAPNRIAAIRAFSHVTQPHLTRVRVGFRAVQVPELLFLSLSFALCHTSTRQPYCRCDGSCGPPNSLVPSRAQASELGRVGTEWPPARPVRLPPFKTHPGPKIVSSHVAANIRRLNLQGARCAFTRGWCLLMACVAPISFVSRTAALVPF